MKWSIKNKRGMTLVQTIVYIVFTLFIMSLAYKIITDMTQRSGLLSNQEMFYSQKDGLYYAIQSSLTEVEPDSLKIEPSTKGKGNKVTYISKETKYEIIQQKEGGMVLKKTTPHDSTNSSDIQSLTYPNISDSEITYIDKVCYGDSKPDYCVEVSNLFEIIVVTEKRVLSRSQKLEARRLFYYAR